MYQECFHLPPQNVLWYCLSIMCTRSDLAEPAGSPVCGSQSSRVPCSLCCLFMLHPKPLACLRTSAGVRGPAPGTGACPGRGTASWAATDVSSEKLDVTAPEFTCRRGVCGWHGLSASGGIQVRHSEHLLALCSGGFWLPQRLSFHILGLQVRLGWVGMVLSR